MREAKIKRQTERFGVFVLLKLPISAKNVGIKKCCDINFADKVVYYK